MCGKASTGKMIDLGGSDKFKAGDKVVIINGPENKFGGSIEDSRFTDGKTVCTVRRYDTLSRGDRGVVVDWEHGEWYVDEDNLRLVDQPLDNLPVGTKVKISDARNNRRGGPIPSIVESRVCEIIAPYNPRSFYKDAYRVRDDSGAAWIVDKERVTLFTGTEPKPFTAGDAVIMKEGNPYLISDTGAIGIIESVIHGEMVSVRFVKSTLSDPSYGRDEGTVFDVSTRYLDHYDGKVEFMPAKSAAFEVGDRVVVTDQYRANDLGITANDTVGIVIAEEDYDGDYRVHFDIRDDWYYYIPGDELAPAPVDSVTEAPAVAETFAPSASHLVADVEGLIAKHGIDNVEATLSFLKSL